jgi:hypothetical protein
MNGPLDPTDYAMLILVKVAQLEIVKANKMSGVNPELRLVCWNCWNQNRTDFQHIPHYANWSCTPCDVPGMICPTCSWMDPWVWGPFGKYGLLFA